MTEVKAKTSQGSVLSDVEQKQTSGVVFDMRSWQGLTEILQAARSAHMEDGAYAAFRDMVLSYAQSGGDPALRARINEVIESLKTPQQKPPVVETPKDIEPKWDSTPAEKSNAPEDRMRGQRPTPVFQKIPTDTTVPEVVEIATPISVKLEVNQEQAAFKSDVPEEPSKLVVPVVSDVTTLIKEEGASNDSVQETTSKTPEDYKMRIAEIKRIVHNEVGNPITLMDAENHVGRTYMNALLNAMKASNAPSSNNIDIAMENLESAFSAIREVAHTKATANAAEAPDHGVEEVVSDATSNDQEIIQDEPLVVATEPDIKDPVVPEEPVLEVVPTVHDTAPVTASEHQVSFVPENLPVAESEPPSAITASVEDHDAVPPPPLMTTPEPTIVLPDQIVAHTIVVPPVESEQSKESFPTKIMDEVATESIPDEEKSISEVSASIPRRAPAPVNEPRDIREAVLGVEQSDLNTPEISTALLQLLHEWSIFEKSGMFGTGPAGHDHPLYKKISVLPMLTVANGGWDNAKPEERQVIKDYIGAWRHEQGISYNPTETFEHYLRRVVQKILKRQKNTFEA